MSILDHLLAEQEDEILLDEWDADERAAERAEIARRREDAILSAFDLGGFTEADESLFDDDTVSLDDFLDRL